MQNYSFYKVVLTKKSNLKRFRKRKNDQKSPFLPKNRSKTLFWIFNLTKTIKIVVKRYEFTKILNFGLIEPMESLKFGDILEKS